jgi:hypothetical protein
VVPGSDVFGTITRLQVAQWKAEGRGERLSVMEVPKRPTDP